METAVTPTDPPAQTPTIAAFRRQRTMALTSGAVLAIATAGLLCGATALLLWGGIVSGLGAGLSVALLVVGMRLGVRSNDRFAALMQQSPRRDDWNWLRSWVDRSPEIATLVATRVTDGVLDVATLHEAWRLMRAEDVIESESLVSMTPEAAERMRSTAHANLARAEP
jgi:hypothetical protein